MTYIYAVIILGGCGLIAAILLTVAAKVFYVKTDERIEKINEALPQANCGACGYAGCNDYASAIVNNGAGTNLCRPGGADSANKIAEILGTSASDVIPMIAVVHCNGDCDATSTEFDFTGIQSCKAAKRFYGGNGRCKFGCLGFGDCMSVCEKDAVSIKNGVAVIEVSLCAACGQCVGACPNNLISIKPISKKYDVLCSSKLSGKETKLSCKNGCIGCKICEKKCPNNAIKVENFCASIDYEKCTNCGECMKACPVKVIHSCESEL